MMAETSSTAATPHRDIRRVGGGAIDNLHLKAAERALVPPGISVLVADSPADAARQMRSAFPSAAALHASARTVGSSSAALIRMAGFDVAHARTRKFPNHSPVSSARAGWPGSGPRSRPNCPPRSTTPTGCDMPTTVQIVAGSGQPILRAIVEPADGVWRGRLAGPLANGPIADLFARYEEAVTGQMLSLIDGLEDGIAGLGLHVLLPDGRSAAADDLQVFPSTCALSFRLRDAVATSGAA